MALNGLYPILLFYLDSTLTPAETAELSQYLAATKLTEADEAKRDALIAQKSNVSLEADPIPIILDGTVITAVPDGYTTQMIKSFTEYGGKPVITNSANTVTINIRSRNKKDGISPFSDVLFGVADFYASLPDSLPRIAYFGGSVVINKGYLLRVSRSQQESSESEIISLEIQRNIEAAATLLDQAGDETANPTKIDATESDLVVTVNN